MTGTAVLAAKVNDTVIRELDIKLCPSYFWTDSEIVLKYIKNELRRFHVYVADRISIIKSQRKSNGILFLEKKILLICLRVAKYYKQNITKEKEKKKEKKKGKKKARTQSPESIIETGNEVVSFTI